MNSRQKRIFSEWDCYGANAEERRDAEWVIERILAASTVSWRKYPEMKPSEPGDYLTLIEHEHAKPSIEVEMWEGEWSPLMKDDKITHWMPLPTPPNTEGEVR